MQTALICMCVLQVEELRSRQEAERKNQEASHSQKMESLKLQYESSIQGVCTTKTHSAQQGFVTVQALMEFIY